MDPWKKKLKKRWKESAVFQRKKERQNLEGFLLYTEQRLSVAQLADLFPLARINTNELLSSRGISHDEARLRLADKNRQRFTRRIRVALRFFRQCVLSAFPLLLLCSSLFCFAVALIGPSSAQNALSMALFQGGILAFVCAIGTFERSRLRRLGKVFHRANAQLHLVVREGAQVAVEERDILPGDLLWVEAGERVPVDLRILWVHNDFRATTDWLTGRAEPTSFTAQAAPRNADLFTVHNILFAKFECTSGKCLGVVIRTGKNTLHSRLLSQNSLRPTDESDRQKRRRESALRRTFRSLVRSIVWLSLGVSTVALLLSLLLTDFARPLHSFVHVFLLFLIASLPQALPLTLGAQLLLVSRRLRKKCGGMFLRQATVADALGSTSVLMVHSPFVLSSKCPTVSELWLAAQNKTINASKLTGDGQTQREKAAEEMLRMVELSTQMGHKRSGEVRQERKTPGNQLEEKAMGGHTAEMALAKFLCQIHPPKSFGLLPICEDECPESIMQAIEGHHSLNLTVCKWETPPSRSNEGAKETDGTLCQGRTYRLIMRGPAEEVAKMCTNVGGLGQDQRNSELMDEQCLTQFEDSFLALSAEAKSCIGFAILDLFDEDINTSPTFACESFSERSFSIGSNSNGWTFLGMLALANPFEANCGAQLAELASGGVRLVLLTDEHPIVAEAMAEQLGFAGKTDKTVQISAIQMPLQLQSEGFGSIFGPKGLSRSNSFSSSSGYHSSAERRDNENTAEKGDKRGSTADSNDSSDFAQSLFAQMAFAGAPRHSVFPQLNSSQILSFVKELQLRGHSVTFVGEDPLRDAPALRLADVGISRSNGSSLLEEASDVLCSNFGLAHLLRAIGECRLVAVNLSSTLAFSLSFSLPALLPVLLSLVLPFPPGMTPLQTLVVTLLIQLPPAVAMAFQRSIGPLKLQKNRGSLVPRGLFLYVYLLASPMFALGSLLAYFAVFWQCGIDIGQILTDRHGLWNGTLSNASMTSVGPSQPLGQARAAWLLTLVLSQLFHSWICVGFLRRKWPGGKIFLNWRLWTANLLELSLLVLLIFVPGINSSLGVDSPPLWVLLFPAGTCLGLLTTITLIKVAIKMIQRVDRTLASRLNSLLEW